MNLNCNVINVVYTPYSLSNVAWHYWFTSQHHRSGLTTATCLCVCERHRMFIWPAWCPGLLTLPAPLTYSLVATQRTLCSKSRMVGLTLWPHDKSKSFILADKLPQNSTQYENRRPRIHGRSKVTAVSAFTYDSNWCAGWHLSCHDYSQL